MHIYGRWRLKGFRDQVNRQENSALRLEIIYSASSLTWLVAHKSIINYDQTLLIYGR